ncbi:hypothetical protein LSTR_LSTR004971 [Laodelphax striatellus]|uniref:Pre-rRNA-processing protein Ipi1 N-terminal domain-containing protein n=1 Tax=Laodelphax striatellus TaxID=195883 RepID=A0A482XN60_LAOST|nr:hypothetical protein LSTR_LSTR004971 [Laodelphax striatellus]
MVKTSHKRFMKKEKNKVKLKGQRLLPKGQNVTNTNFKVKKIVIKEQLKAADNSELLSKKKLNVKELVSRLTHHNVSMRREALLGLKQTAELCTAEAFVRYLPTMLESAASLVIDRDSDVRADSLKLLRAVLAKVSLEQITPLFSILSSFLVCAMTHIDISIREDSLKLLDIMLNECGPLVAARADELLPRFIDLISQNSGGVRTLSLHMGGKLTVGKWRAQVLYRLWKLLSSLQKKPNNANKSEAGCQVVQWNDDVHLYVPLYSDMKLQSCNEMLNFDRKTGASKSSATTKIQDYMEKLIPLLLDTFTEVAPLKSKDNNSKDDIDPHDISSEATILLQCIVDIILLLLDLLRDSNNASVDWFSETYSTILKRRLIMKRYPYKCSQLRLKQVNKKQAKEVSALLKVVEGTQQADGLCLLQNLGLSRLILLTLKNDNDRISVVKYLISCLRNCSSLNEEHSRMLKSCLEAACATDSNKEVRSLLETVASLAEKYKVPDRPFSRMLFDFLSDIALHYKYSYLHDSVAFKNWLSNLPELLTLPTVEAKTVKRITMIATRNSNSFVEGLDGFIESILDNVVPIKIISAHDELEVEQCRREMINLLYWVKDWDEDMIDNLQKAVNNCYFGEQLTSHLMNLLTLKASKEPDGQFSNLIRKEEWKSLLRL